MAPESSENNRATQTGGLRYKIGLTMFVVGNIIVFSSPVVVPALGLPLAWIGAFVVGGEVFALGAIPVLGMAGFKELKNKMFSVFKMPPVDQLKPVSRFRHVLGLTLVFGSVLLQWGAAVFIAVGLGEATPENPFPAVLGIPFEHQLSTFLTLTFAAEAAIVIGLFTLGGLWWERMRNLFIWPGHQEQAS